MYDPIEEYYMAKRISNSLLGAIKNPRLFRMKLDNPAIDADRDDTALRIGSAVDCLLTSPERWDSEFHVLSANKPTGLMEKFVNALKPGLNEFSPEEDYEEAYRKSGYKKPIKWVIDYFWRYPDTVLYYKQKTSAPPGKKILSTDEKVVVDKARELILASPFTYKYFKKTSSFHELRHQIPIYFEMEGEEFKALLDGILIDHREKLIQPFDLKTTGKDIYKFKDSYLEFGYYRQAALYETALFSDESPVKDLIDEGYVVLDFIFIVVEKSSWASNPAIIYKTTSKDRWCGMNGCYLDKIKYPGILELLEEYRWHRDSNNWVYPKDVYTQEGVMLLDVFN